MRNRIKSIECANCKHIFDAVNNFCPHCGQENHTHKLPIKHFVLEFIESLTHFDTKIFRTFKDMILKPGLVTKNYNNNKRARYVPPVRIYIFMSFILFFLISTTYHHEIETNAEKMDREFRQNFTKNQEFGQVRLFSRTQLTTDIFISLTKIPNITNTQIDSVLKQAGSKTDWINTRIVNTMIKVYDGKLTFSQIVMRGIKYLSYAMLMFMPFFALIVMPFYNNKNRYYSEFLVFSIYFTTFLFAVLCLFVLFNKYVYNGANAFLLLMFGIYVYLGLSLKNVYAESILKTIVKTILISILFTFSLLFFAMMMFVSSIV
jgi:hypothetical protein